MFKFKTPPRSLFPARLHRKNIYVLPTGHGLLFIAVLGAMLVGSINYNNNLGFLLTFLLGGMAFVSIFHTTRNLSGISVLSARARPVFAGDMAAFILRVHPSAGHRPAVRFRFAGGAALAQDLMGDQDNRVVLRAQARRRGRMRPGVLLISTRYPFGLFRAWSRLNAPISCLVYPRPIPTPPAYAHQLADAAGEGAAPAGGGGADDFQGLRPYQPGDTLQRIAWKTYSQGQGLFTKSFVGKRRPQVMLDWDQTGPGDMETRLSRLCHRVLHAHRQGMRFGLRLPGETLAPGSAEPHKRACLRALALFGEPEAGGKESGFRQDGGKGELSIEPKTAAEQIGSRT